jgi:hypothetical protein
VWSKWILNQISICHVLFAVNCSHNSRTWIWGEWCTILCTSACHPLAQQCWYTENLSGLYSNSLVAVGRLYEAFTKFGVQNSGMMTIRKFYRLEPEWDEWIITENHRPQTRTQGYRPFRTSSSNPWWLHCSRWKLFLGYLSPQECDRDSDPMACLKSRAAVRPMRFRDHGKISQATG